MITPAKKTNGRSEGWAAVSNAMAAAGIDAIGHHNDPEQQRRDEIKAKLLKAKGITLIVLTAVDLSLDTIGAKLKAAGIPLCDLSPYASLANYVRPRQLLPPQGGFIAYKPAVESRDIGAK